mgnify:CR=1 FL=1
MSAEFLPDCLVCGISISSKAASCISALKASYLSQSQYAFLTTTLPFTSSLSRTSEISNFGNFSSLTPSATFSKSQKSARLRSVIAPPGETSLHNDSSARGEHIPKVHRHLDDDDVLCLKSFLTLSDVELDRLSFLQCSISVTDDGAKMRKNVRALALFNKAKSLLFVKPLYRASRCSHDFYPVLRCSIMPSTGKNSAKN